MYIYIYICIYIYIYILQTIYKMEVSKPKCKTKNTHCLKIAMFGYVK